MPTQIMKFSNEILLKGDGTGIGTTDVAVDGDRHRDDGQGRRTDGMRTDVSIIFLGQKLLIETRFLKALLKSARL